MSFLGFSINDIKEYLLINDGKVGYHELVNHFKHFLSDPNTQIEARMAFKDYVNRLASVSVEQNKKYLVLRPEFMNEMPNNDLMVMTDVRNDAINTIGLPIVDNVCLHSLNNENQSKEAMVQMRAHRTEPNTGLNSGLNRQYSFCQQYTETPPQPPPRRRSSTGGSKAKLEERLKPFHEERNDKENINVSPPQQQEKLKEIHELSTKTPGRVKEHAQKINKMASLTELKPPMPLTVSTTSSRSKARSLIKDEDTDSGSVQPLDPLRRKWIISSSNCDYNELVSLLKEEPKLSAYKDFTSGYTALHWAAKFNKPEIVKLLAGKYGVSPDIKSNGGYTPLHLAAINKNESIMELLIKTYNADTNIRDFSGKRPTQYLVNKLNTNNISGGKHVNGIVTNQPHIFGPSVNHKPIQVRTASESSSSFIRIGSLKAANKMKKITGIGLKSWGSVESISENNSMPSQNPKKTKKTKKSFRYSTPERPPLKDSDSDSAYGFQ